MQGDSWPDASHFTVGLTSLASACDLLVLGLIRRQVFRFSWGNYTGPHGNLFRFSFPSGAVPQLYPQTPQKALSILLSFRLKITYFQFLLWGKRALQFHFWKYPAPCFLSTFRRQGGEPHWMRPMVLQVQEEVGTNGGDWEWGGASTP